MTSLPSPNVLSGIVGLSYLFFVARGNFIHATLHCVVALLLMLAARVFINVRKMMRPDDSIILYSLAPSPFVEKTRWEMQRLNIRFREKFSLGITFMFTGHSVPMIRIPSGWSESFIADSTTIARYWWGKYCMEPHAQWLKPTADTCELEQLADQTGAALQRYVYYYLLQHDDGKYIDVARHVWGAHEPLVPAWQRLLQPALAPLQRQMLLTAFNLRSPKAHSSSLNKIRDAFKTIDERLSDGRKYLCGPQLTHADISVCAILGMALFLDEYGSPKGSRVTLSALPKEAREELSKLGKTKAAEYIRRVYKQDRWAKAK